MKNALQEIEKIDGLIQNAKTGIEKANLELVRVGLEELNKEREEIDLEISSLKKRLDNLRMQEEETEDKLDALDKMKVEIQGGVKALISTYEKVRAAL